ARVRRELIRSPSQKGGRRRVYRPWTRFEHSNGMCQAPETAFGFLQVCCGKGNSPSLMSDCPIRNVRVGSKPVISDRANVFRFGRKRTCRIGPLYGVGPAIAA